MSAIKYQLLDAIEIMKGKVDYAKEILEEKDLSLRKMIIKQTIRTLRIPLCVSSPSTLEKFMNENKGGVKKSNAGWESEKKIEIKLKADQGCIHEKLSMMKELSLSAGAIALAPSKSKNMNQSVVIYFSINVLEIST